MRRNNWLRLSALARHAVKSEKQQQRNASFALWSSEAFSSSRDSIGVHARNSALETSRFLDLAAGSTTFGRHYSKPPAAQDTPHDHEHVNIENEIEKELQRAGDRGGIDALLQVIEAHGEDFDEMNVATAFHELAKVAGNKSKDELEGTHVHDTFQTLVDMAILGRRRYNARHLTSILQSAAELKYDDEELMDKLSQNLLTRMDKLDAIEVTDLATGLAALGHSPSVILFEALQKRADTIKDDLSDDQIKAMKDAFKKLGYEDYGKKI